MLLEEQEWYQEMLKKADEKYPKFEDKFCDLCGCRLVRGSANWYEGHHMDGCK